MNTRMILKVGAPIVAILTLMLGLRIGAGEAVHAAVVFGAPPGAPGPDGKTRLAWQVLTVLQDRGVTEAVALPKLEVIARSEGRVARWAGASNGDGIAEAALELDGIAYGDAIDIDVRAEGELAPLASGRALWPAPAPAEADRLAAVRPTVRSGAIGLDVMIEGERLIVGSPTSLWIHATPPPGIAATGLIIEVSPEPGLMVARERVRTCGAGWAEIEATAQAHVLGAGFVAGGGDAQSGGRWFGALPVAGGAFFVSMPRRLPAGAAATVVLVAPNPRDVVYAEVDDARGRVVAAALPVAVEPGDPMPRARFELPPLAPGLHWLVASGEPRGAERLAGAAVARPFLVGDGIGTGAAEAPVDVHEPCSLGPWLARHPARGFPRWIALDGLPARNAKNRQRHNLGLAIGFVSLFAAAVLETLLLVAASREARISLQLAALDEDDPDAKRVTARSPGGGLVLAVLIAILGLALLAVLLIAKA